MGFRILLLLSVISTIHCKPIEVRVKDSSGPKQSRERYEYADLLKAPLFRPNANEKISEFAPVVKTESPQYKSNSKANYPHASPSVNLEPPSRASVDYYKDSGNSGEEVREESSEQDVLYPPLDGASSAELAAKYLKKYQPLLEANKNGKQSHVQAVNPKNQQVYQAVSSSAANPKSQGYQAVSSSAGNPKISGYQSLPLVTVPTQTFPKKYNANTEKSKHQEYLPIVVEEDQNAALLKQQLKYENAQLKKINDNRQLDLYQAAPSFGGENRYVVKPTDAAVVASHDSLDSIHPKSSDDRVQFQMHGHDGPQSYKFGYDTGKGKNRQFRFEQRDKEGYVNGHYGYYDHGGKVHMVKYHASPDGGFHAEPEKVQ